jgi:hypothetical protein
VVSVVDIEQARAERSVDRDPVEQSVSITWHRDGYEISFVNHTSDTVSIEVMPASTMHTKQTVDVRQAMIERGAQITVEMKLRIKGAWKLRLGMWFVRLGCWICGAMLKTTDADQG